MAEPSGSNSVTLPSSQYAQELSRGVASRSFGTPLEVEYLRKRLAEDCTMIRVASVLALVIASMRGAEQIVNHAWNNFEFVQFVAGMVCSVVLTAVAFSPWFGRAYMPVAQ